MWTSDCKCWMSMQKACNLLHTPQQPNDSVLGTCSDTVWVLYLYCRFMDYRSYVGPQGLHGPNANPINCLSAYRWWNDFTITTVLLIAPLCNFCHTVTRNKAQHNDLLYLAVSDNEHVKAWRKSFPWRHGHQWQSLVRSAFHNSNVAVPRPFLPMQGV